MHTTRLFYGIHFIIILLFFGSCEPKSVVTDPVLLKESSRDWIPYAGGEQVVFYQDTNKAVFSSEGKMGYFDRIRYMSDQSGFFSNQMDYYADLERVELTFTSPTTDYFMKYCLEKGKGESGEWDILRVKIADDSYYSNDMKIVIYQSDGYDKGEVYKFKATITLNGNIYRDVYYTTQERRPFELYYTAERGIIAFKVSSNELWTLDPVNMN